MAHYACSSRVAVVENLSSRDTDVEKARVQAFLRAESKNEKRTGEEEQGRGRERSLYGEGAPQKPNKKTRDEISHSIHGG